jgi:hypothetical protein
MKGKIIVDGYHFKNENEYRRYKGLLALVKEGRIKLLEVHPKYMLMIHEIKVDEYTPTFRFHDSINNVERFIQVVNSTVSPVQELRIRLFEVLYNTRVERWG